MISKRLLAVLVFCVISSASASAIETYEAPPVVIGLGSFGRSVANLDKAVAFYRDVLGMEVIERELPEPAADPAMQKLAGTPGARTRTVHLRVPYVAISVALTEFSGIEQKPLQGNPGQPGIPWLTLSVKDDASFVGIDKAKPPTYSLFGDRPAPQSGAVAANPPPTMKRQGFGTVSRVAFIRDADGFLVEVMHRDPKGWFTVANPLVHAEEGGRPIPGPPVVGLQFVLWQRSEDSLRFYRDLLGFDIRPGYTRSLQELYTISEKLPEGDCAPDQVGASLSNMADQRPVNGCWQPQMGPPGLTPRGKGTRGVSGNCAGVRCEWFENDPAGAPFQPRIQDPGAGYLSLWVRDIDAVLKQMRAAGVEVVSTGGKPVKMNGGRSVMVRDLSRGFYVILMERDSER